MIAGLICPGSPPEIEVKYRLINAIFVRDAACLALTTSLRFAFESDSDPEKARVAFQNWKFK